MADELNTASVAVQDPPVVAAPSPSVPAANPTEDEIFASISHAAEEPVVDQTTPPSEPVEDQLVDEEAEVVAPTDEELEASPTEDSQSVFREFNKQIKEAPRLRDHLGREQRYTEMSGGDFKFAVDLFQAVPDRVALDQIKSDSSEWQRHSQQLADSPEDFISDYAQKNPQAFERMARAMPDLQRQLNPREWLNQRTEAFQEIMDNAGRIAHANGDQEVLASLQVVCRELGVRLGASQAAPRTDPRDAELAKLRKEREDRQAQEVSQSFETATASITEEFRGSILASIESDLKTALVKAGVAEPNEKMLGRMISETYEKLNKKLSEQGDTMRTKDNSFNAIKQLIEKGRPFSGEKKSFVDYVLRKANTTKPAILREVVNEWTSSIIGAQQKKIAVKQTVAAQTKDAAGSGAPPAKAKPSPVPGRKRGPTEEEIFASIGR